jgi:hypothetical protein
VDIIRRGQEHAEAGRADGVGAGTLGRRGVLGALAALPVLYSVGSAAPALAATSARPGGVLQETDGLERGVERRYNAPLLTAGTRLVLPEGIKAVAVQDFYHKPRTASAQRAWPYVTAADGTTVDASLVPERGAATRVALLSGFAEGWYELRHAGGRRDRVTWDARRLPILWLYGEYGGTNEAPFRNRFYTLALQAFSRDPYSRNKPAE